MPLSARKVIRSFGVCQPNGVTIRPAAVTWQGGVILGRSRTKAVSDEAAARCARGRSGRRPAQPAPPPLPTGAHEAPLPLAAASAGLAWPITFAALLWLVLVGGVPVLRLLAEIGTGGRCGPYRGCRRVAGSAAHPAGGAGGGGHRGGDRLVCSPPRCCCTPCRRGGCWCSGSAAAAGAASGAGAVLYPHGWSPSSPLLLALGLAPPLGSTNPIYSPGGIMLLLGIRGAAVSRSRCRAGGAAAAGDAIAAARGIGASDTGAAGSGAAAAVARAGGGHRARLCRRSRQFRYRRPDRHPGALSAAVGADPGRGLSGIGPSALAQVAALSLLLAAMALPGLLLQAYAARAAALPTGAPFQPLPRAAQPLPRQVPPMSWRCWWCRCSPASAAAFVPALGMEIGPHTATWRNFAPSSRRGAHPGGAAEFAVAGGDGSGRAGAGHPAGGAGAAWAAGAHPLGVADLPYALPGACTGVAAILVAFLLPGGRRCTARCG